MAKSVQDAEQLTRVGLFVGTIDYASPEQIRNEALDGRSDLYSLACVFFQCLAGQVPFDRPTEHAVIEAHLRDPAPQLHSLRADLPTAIDTVFAVALAKDPGQRYRTCHHFAEAARGALESRPRPVDRLTVVDAVSASVPAVATSAPVASIPVPSSQVAQPRKRRVWLTVAGLLTVVAMIGGVELWPYVATRLLGTTSSVVAPQTVATPAATATAFVTATPTAAPTHPYPVQFSADQVIMPPSEFPLAGYVIDSDQRSGQFRWFRDYASSTGPYAYIPIYVTVLQTSIRATDQLARLTCDWTWDTPATPREITAEVIAEGAKACQYTFIGNKYNDYFVYTAASRKVKS